jgi:hypothetical protein
MTATRTTSGNSVPTEFAAMAAEPIVAACRAYFLDLPMAMTSETLRFMGHRLEEQAKLLSSLSTCHTLSDVTEVQASFFKTAVGDYRKEAGTLMHRAKETVI